MAAADGDAAHHALRNDASGGRRIDDGFENLADSRFGYFRHFAYFLDPAILFRGLIAGVAVVTYMQRGMKSKLTVCRAEAGP
jgi:hypothetical protein